MGSCASVPKGDHQQLDCSPPILVAREVQPRSGPSSQAREELLASSLMSLVNDEHGAPPRVAARTPTPVMETSFVASSGRRDFPSRSLVGGSPLPDMREAEVSPTHRPLSPRSGREPRSLSSSKSNSRNQDPSLVAASMSTWSQSTVDRFAALVFPPLMHHSGSTEQDEEDADAARSVDASRAASAVRKEELGSAPQENHAENY